MSFGGTPIVKVAGDNPFASTSPEFNPFTAKEFVPGKAIIEEEFLDPSQAPGGPQEPTK